MTKAEREAKEAENLAAGLTKSGKKRMKHASRRQKGQNAERDVCKILQPIIDEVWAYCKVEKIPQLCRNLQQTQDGGHDLSGLDWISIEVKHHAQANPSQLREWWGQTLRQAGDSLEPVLFYRSNGQPFRVRMMQWWQAGPVSGKLLVDIELADFVKWFRWRVYHELIKCLHS
jgi:hypothetical protein